MLANARGWEWVILLLLVLLLFGARRLPDLARSVGRSMKIFRSEVKDLRNDEPKGPVTDQRTADEPGVDRPAADLPTVDRSTADRPGDDDGDPPR